MSRSVQWKVCGVTAPEIAHGAAQAGAGHLGFIFYPPSPRNLTHERYTAMAGQLPPLRQVAVSVEPDLGELQWFVAQGFDRFQVHFRPDVPIKRVEAWSQLVTPAKLWLAPKIPPGAAFRQELLPLAHTFLLDTFAPDKFGGTGQTGDWNNYRALQAAHPDKTWILSGGLNADNVAEAVRATGATFVDVNSGVESAPGVKDLGKLQAFAAALGRL